MSETGNGRSVPWAWLAVALFGILVSVGGYFANDTKAAVESVKQKQEDARLREASSDAELRELRKAVDRQGRVLQAIARKVGVEIVE